MKSISSSGKMKFQNYLFVYFSLKICQFRAPVTMDFFFKNTVDTMLSFPYNECEDREMTYRQVNCINMCIQKSVQTKYNCSFPNFYLNKNQNKCTTEIKDKKKEFEYKCRLQCPAECSRNVITTSNYPLSSPNQPVNEITVYSFFSSLNELKMTQIPKTSYETLLSDMGGNFGLFLGISCINVFEILEFLYKIIKATLQLPFQKKPFLKTYL